MNKLQFKALNSQFRKISKDAYSEANLLASRTGCDSHRAFGEIMNKNERAFNEAHGFNFNKTLKTTTRDLIVSMKIVRKLDYPSWAFESIRYS